MPCEDKARNGRKTRDAKARRVDGPLHPTSQQHIEAPRHMTV